MRLSAKYNRVNLVTSLTVLVLTGLVYYAVIHYILTEKLDRDLRIEADEVNDYVDAYHKLPLPGNFKDQQVVYRQLKKGETIEEAYLYTTYINPKEKEVEPGRSLVLPIVVGDRRYEVMITKSRVESEDLIRIIFLITLGVTAILLLSVFLINRFVLSKLWKPFYAILHQLKAFTLAGNEELKPEETEIEEFTDLNHSLVSMSLRLKEDYTELKSFTDNASHEMMTPLAVLNSKLDTLLQTGPFSVVQGELIQDIYGAAGRLSKLNHTMLLLAKIENNLLIDQEKIDFKILIEQKARQFQELVQQQNLQLELQLQSKEILLSKYLADILINNLMFNAIRHNKLGGIIFISLNKQELKLINTGAAEALNAGQIFNRFNKSGTSEGMGLGLAIVRQICNLYRFGIDYAYQGDQHIFTVTFND